MDLVLNNQQSLIGYKPQTKKHNKPTKPNPTYLIYTYKEDKALNNLQRLICHKRKPNQIIYSVIQTCRDRRMSLLYPGFVLFCLGNIGSNLGPDTISLISEFLLYPGYTILIYLYEEDLALNNLQSLLCHKNKPNQNKLNQTKPKLDQTMPKQTKPNQIITSTTTPGQSEPGSIIDAGIR